MKRRSKPRQSQPPTSSFLRTKCAPQIRFVCFRPDFLLLRKKSWKFDRNSGSHYKQPWLPKMSNNNNQYEVNGESAARIPPSSAPAFERHFSVRELAALWGLSERTIRRMFASEPGVVALTRNETRSKRAYKTMRIPESVAQRVYRRLRRAS